MIEAHVLKALRTNHGVSIKHVRTALYYAEGQLGIRRLLLSKELLSSAGELFLNHYGQLINLSASGQLYIARMMNAHLRRVEWDDKNLPIRLYPFVQGEQIDTGKYVAIDPNIAFGRPVLVSRGVTTSVIADRYDAGETVAELAADYRVGESEIEEAILYESAA